MEKRFNDHEKWCNHCKQWKPLAGFSQNKQTASGLAGFCKECMSLKNKEVQSRYKERAIVAETKACSLCRQTKPAADFARNGGSPDGLRYRCRQCDKETGANVSERRTETRKRWVENNPEKAKRNDLRSLLKRKFGITLEQYEDMQKAQDGKCAICKREAPFWRLAVDHDHKTGKVRALLCHHCNSGIGHFREDREVLQNAIDYLEQHKE